MNASETELDEWGARTRRLLDGARYLNLATASADGRPWIATLQYAWLGGPLRLVFGSAASSRHGRDLAAWPRVSGSLFLTGGSAGLDVASIDGAQFEGRCTELAGAELETYRPFFYAALFPDAAERERWALPTESLRAPAEHRLYLVEVERWWLVDTRDWERDRIDRRLEVPLDDVKLS